MERRRLGEVEIERVPDWSGVWWWLRWPVGTHGPMDRHIGLPDIAGEAIWAAADPARVNQIKAEARVGFAEEVIAILDNPKGEHGRWPRTYQDAQVCVQAIRDRAKRLEESE